MVESLFESPVLQDELTTESEEELLTTELKDYHSKLPGIKLPSTNADWDLANDYFKLFLYDDTLGSLMPKLITSYQLFKTTSHGLLLQFFL